MSPDTKKKFRKIAVTFAGCTVILLGILLSPIPGPGGIPLIIAGLSILATEFAWAKNLLKKGREKFAEITHRFIPKKEKPAARVSSTAPADKQ